MTKPFSFYEIQKQHQGLLRQLSEIDDFDPDDPRVKVFLEEVNGFLDIIAQAGTYTEESDRRSLLRDFIRFWSSEINTKTGNLRIVQLKPFDLPVTRRRSNFKFLRRPIALIVGLSLIIILSVLIILGVFILIRSNTHNPPVKSRNPCLTKNPPTSLPSGEPYMIFL